MKVSVVVPVYNPGPNIDDLLRSLDEQSLPVSEWEAVLVDDGSTDDTPAKLEAYAAARPNVRVQRIPNSGWPGTPRNVGTDLARGEYVLYVDNDDWLAPEALQRLHARAAADDADVVLGKVVGHGKLVPRAVFRRDRTDVDLHRWDPLLRLLSPHKLFRRALLDEHGIRFPDGRHRLEDHLFVMHAYFHAETISVLADHPIYHWALRGGTNASARIEPAAYFRDLRRVLDLIDEHVQPGPRHDRLYAHWYSSKVLKRAGGINLLRRREADREAMYAELHTLAVERFHPRIDARLWFAGRIRSRLLREAGLAELVAFAQVESKLQTDARLVAARRDGADLVVSVAARLSGPGGPLALRQHGEALEWVPPPSLAAQLEGHDLDVGGDRTRDWLELVVRSAQHRTEYTLKVAQRQRLESLPGTDGLVTPVVEGEARVSAAGKRPLRPGDWVLAALPRIAGFTPAIEAVADPAGTVSLAVTPGGKVRLRSRLRRRLTRRAPGVARAGRRVKRRMHR